MSDIVENKEEKWDTVLEPSRKLLDLKLREVIRYRDLIYMFVKRDFTVTFKQTVLGPLWYLIQPFFSTIVYSFVFGGIAGIATDGVPHTLFYFAGNMLWTYFTACLTSCSGTFTANAGMFGKIYFPRLVAPIASCVMNIIKLGIQFAMLLILYFYFLIVKAPIVPSWWILAFPLLIMWIGMLGAGMGLVISSLTTKYRDLNHLLTFGIQLAMYATPIIYPLSEAPAEFAWFFYINPMSAPIELFRIWFYGAGSVPPLMILISLGWTALFMFFGLVMFNKNERTFIDVI